MMNPDLTDDEKDVMFGGATEPPFTGKLLHEDRAGDFVCKNCGHILFNSGTKFDSGSGWPSFTEPANLEHVILKQDESFGMSRTEILCAKCGAHLGHLFDDGPVEAGGMRYCINSACLNFEQNKSGDDKAR
jgi:peptide-methionine (R)-S-oxide reductase